MRHQWARVARLCQAGDRLVALGGAARSRTMSRCSCVRHGCPVGRHWLITTLGLPATDPARYTWEPVTPGGPDHMPNTQRLLHVVADRQRWHAALTLARARANGQAAPELPATGRAA